MGHGIAQVFATAGASVTVHDSVVASLLTVPDRVAANLHGLGLDPRPAETIALQADLETAVAGADWVFEAAPENLALKQELFERIDRIISPNTVLATNSSVMRPT